MTWVLLLVACNTELGLSIPEECGFADVDEDGFGNSEDSVSGLRCNNVNTAENGQDCDDGRADAFPGGTEVPYDGTDNDCNPATLDDDLDRDGFAIADDCDDDDPLRNPDATERPYDGVDNDCDPQTRDDDLDGDGFVRADDCDDDDGSVHLEGELELAELTAAQLPTVCRERCLGSTVLRGDVTIAGAVNTLTGLRCLNEVDGAVTLRGITAPTLAGLDLVTRISGDLTIDGADGLADLSGLDLLGEIGGSLRVEGNEGLQRVTEGAPGLASVEGDLTVIDNPRMSDESGTALADSLVLGGQATVADNGLVLDFGDGSFEEVGIWENPSAYLVFPDELVPQGIATTTTTGPRSGARALETRALTGTDDAWITVYEQHLADVVPGQRFALTGFGRAPAAEPLTEGCTGFLVIKYFGADLEPFLGWSTSPTISSTTETDTWIPLLAEGTVPPGAASLQAGVELSIDGTCTGTAQWEDVKLRLTNL